MYEATVLIKYAPPKYEGEDLSSRFERGLQVTKTHNSLSYLRMWCGMQMKRLNAEYAKIDDMSDVFFKTVWDM